MMTVPLWVLLFLFLWQSLGAGSTLLEGCSAVNVLPLLFLAVVAVIFGECHDVRVGICMGCFCIIGGFLWRRHNA